MTKQGVLIALEGIDGSGKQTQARLLEHSLTNSGHSVLFTGFPQYDSWFGQMITKFLNGELGPLESVDPRFSALLYAGDRFEAKSQLQSALQEGKIVLTDRYIASNMAHQVARAPVEQRSDLLRWIEYLEYTDLRVAAGKPDSVHACSSQRSAENGGEKSGTLLHLRKARYSGAQPATPRGRRPYVRHALALPPLGHDPVFRRGRGSMRLPEEIAAETLEAVQTVLANKSTR